MSTAAADRDKRPRGLSLRLKLTLWMLGVFLLIYMSLGVLFISFQRKAVRADFVNHISTRGQALAEEIAPNLPEFTADDLAELERSELQSLYVDQMHLSLYYKDGKIFASPTVPPQEYDWQRMLETAIANPAALLTLGDFIVGNENDFDPPAEQFGIHQFTGADGQDYVLMVTSRDDYVRRTVNLAARVVLYTASFGAIAVAIAGWMIAGLAIAPIRDVHEAVEQFSATALEDVTDKNNNGDEDRVDFAELSPEMQELRQQLDDTKDRLERAFLAQERFISNISHELKTPIAVLLTESDVLHTQDLPDDAKEFVASVREEMRRLGELVESFLMLTKIREGKAPVYSSRHPANDLVMDAVAHCSKVARQRSVRLDPTILDREDEIGTLVTGDHSLLRTMLDNLIVNAIRFSPENERVHVTMERAGDELQIRVRDHGPGIPEDKLQEIFDRFTRAHEERTQGRGYGLGLQIAQGIAELHRGNITAHNHEGGGCEFIVTLPVAT